MVNKQSIVGIFMLIGLVCVAYLTIKLGKMELFGSKGYTVSAQFSSISGLRNGADVEIAGVVVGRVSNISLDSETYLARVEMVIDEEIILSDDTIAAIKTSGLIGDKYVGLEPGGSESLLSEGSVIWDTNSSVDIEALISKYVFGGV